MVSEIWHQPVCSIRRWTGCWISTVLALLRRVKSQFTARLGLDSFFGFSSRRICLGPKIFPISALVSLYHPVL